MSATTVAIARGDAMNLDAALLVYTSRSNRQVYVSAHRVHRGANDRPQLGAGAPATAEALSLLLAPVVGALSFRGFIPERLLAVAPGVMVWWCPPGERAIWFRCEDEKGAAILGRGGERHARVNHPGLVFAVARGTWYVFAVKGASRPTEASALYRAPYFNVWADRGEICVGNVATPKAADHAAIAAWERAFFDSRFTHPNPGFRVRFKGGGFALWRMLLDAGARAPFPTRVLYPAGRDLARLVRDLTKEPSK